MNPNLSKAITSGPHTAVARRRSLGRIYGGPQGGVFMKPAAGRLDYAEAKRERAK